MPSAHHQNLRDRDIHPTPATRLNKQPAIGSDFGQDGVFILPPLADIFKPQKAIAFAGVKSIVAVGRNQKSNRAIFGQERSFPATSKGGDLMS